MLIMSYEDKVCVICLDEMDNEYIQFSCKHNLHYECFRTYLYHFYNIENSYFLCPICRTSHEVDIHDIVRFLL